jgi:gas vesicle protein
MDSDTQRPGDYRFALGLLAGTVVGAGLVMWLAPRTTSEIRKRITDSAKKFGTQTSDEFTRRARGVRDDVAGAVARGAHEVERQSTAARSDRGGA